MFSSSIDQDSDLRLFETRHAEELNALVTRNFDHLHKWSAWLTDRERPVDRTGDWIVQNLTHFAAGTGYEVGIWHKGEIAGQIGYNGFDANHKVEIGYWLGEVFQGNGLITRSCRIMIDHAFRNLNINRSDWGLPKRASHVKPNGSTADTSISQSIPCFRVNGCQVVSKMTRMNQLASLIRPRQCGRQASNSDSCLMDSKEKRGSSRLSTFPGSPQVFYGRGRMRNRRSGRLRSS